MKRPIPASAGSPAAFGAFLRRTRTRLGALCAPRGVRAFIAQLGPGARILDVGCGNNSPFKTKIQRPDLHYIGIDVGDYNQTAPMLADEYIVATPESFGPEIQALAGKLEGVISSHNIEHCNDPELVLAAITRALKPGGRLYLSFPSEASTRFPHRDGCLNFFDDPTHREVPDFDRIVRQLEEGGCRVTFATRRYRPIALLLIGALLEPLSRWRGRTAMGTWALYGFEAVIWATRSPAPPSMNHRAS